MLKRFQFAIVCIFSFGVLSACQTAPVKYDKINEGQWDGRVLIKDKRKNQSQIVSLDINAIKDEKIRINVTAAMGTPVAALAVNGNTTQYALFRQKAFYEGVTQAKVLGPILSIEMDPRLLFSVLFDQEITEKGWSCNKDDKGLLKLCENKVQGLTIEWMDRSNRKKTVKIDHVRASLQLSLEDFKPKVVAQDDLFNLKAPAGFKTYVIR